MGMAFAGDCRKAVVGDCWCPLGSHAGMAEAGVWQGSSPARSPAAGRTLLGVARELQGAGKDGMSTSEKIYSIRGGIQNMNYLKLFCHLRGAGGASQVGHCPWEYLHTCSSTAAAFSVLKGHSSEAAVHL